MHWHAPVGLAFLVLVISAVMMTQTHRFVCVACDQRAGGTFTTAYPTARSAKIHVSMSPPCRAADLGIREIVLDTRQTDAMVGGSGATGPAPDLRHQPPGSAWECKTKVEVGIYYTYTKYMTSITRSENHMTSIYLVYTMHMLITVYL